MTGGTRRFLGICVHLWLVGATGLLVFLAWTTIWMSGHTLGRSTDYVRWGIQGTRWPFYRALAALPPDAAILLENPADELYYFASYFAFPRVVIRWGERGDAASADPAISLGARMGPVYRAQLNGKTGEFLIRGPLGAPADSARVPEIRGPMRAGAGGASPGAPGMPAFPPPPPRPPWIARGLGILLATASLYLLGWLALAAFVPRGDPSFTRVERFALSYPLGALLLTLAFFAAAMTTRGIGILPLAPLWVIALLAAFLERRRGKTMPDARTSPGTPFSGASFLSTRIGPRVLKGLLTATLILIAFAVIAEPVWKWDAVAMWSMKARILFEEHGLRGASYHLRAPEFARPDYPILVPALEAWGYLFMRSVDDWTVKLVFVPFAPALAALLYAHGRRLLAPRLGLLLAFLGLTLPAALVRWTAGALPTGYADYPLALFIMGAGIYLYRWLAGGAHRDLFLTALLAAAAAWTKSEGLLAAALFAAIWLIAAMAGGTRTSPVARLRAPIAAALLAGAIILPWMLFLRTLPPGPRDYELTDFSLPLLWSNRARLPLLAAAYAREILDVRHWLLLWPTLVAALIAARGNLRAPERALTAFIGVQFAGYFVVHWISRTDPRWYLGTSVRRLVLQLAPLAVALTGAALARLERKPAWP